MKTLCTILLGAMTLAGIGATGSSAATTMDNSASKANAQGKERLACGRPGQPPCTPPATCGVRG